MHKIIPVTVRDKIATKTGDEVYICGNSDFVIEFDFDAEWNEHDTKTARFEWNGGHQDVIFSGNTCPVPIISDTHRFHVGVYAGNLRTTTAAYVPARKSILCGSGTPHAPQPDVYAQIMEELGGRVTQEQMAQAIDQAMAAEFFFVRIDGNNVSDHTEEEIQAAVGEGKICIAIDYIGGIYTYVGRMRKTNSESGYAETFYMPMKHAGVKADVIWIQISGNQAAKFLRNDARLANPWKLTLTGAVEAEYDGTKQTTVKIPKVGEDTDLTVKSSTPGSKKKFKITVDDSGTITAAELT